MSKLRYFTYGINNYYIQQTTSIFDWELISVVPSNANLPIKDNANADTVLTTPFTEVQTLIITLYSLQLTSLDFIEVLENLVRLVVRNNSKIASIKFHANCATYLAPNDKGTTFFGLKIIELHGCSLLTTIPSCKTLVSLVVNNCGQFTNLTAGSSALNLSYPALRNLFIQACPISSIPSFVKDNAIGDYLTSLSLIDTNIVRVDYNTRFLYLVPRTSLSATLLDFNNTNIGMCVVDDYYTVLNTTISTVNNFNETTTTGNDATIGYLHCPHFCII